MSVLEVLSGRGVQVAKKVLKIDQVPHVGPRLLRSAEARGLLTLLELAGGLIADVAEGYGRPLQERRAPPAAPEVSEVSEGLEREVLRAPAPRTRSSNGILGSRRWRGTGQLVGGGEEEAVLGSQEESLGPRLFPLGNHK
jgi:hypothetical protein